MKWLDAHSLAYAAVLLRESRRAMTLYEIASQVVPLLMIALFVDSRTVLSASRRADIVRSRVYVTLSTAAFIVAVLTVAGVLEPGVVTEAIVLGALLGCIVLLSVQAWARPRNPPPGA